MEEKDFFEPNLEQTHDNLFYEVLDHLQFVGFRPGALRARVLATLKPKQITMCLGLYLALGNRVAKAKGNRVKKKRKDLYNLMVSNDIKPSRLAIAFASPYVILRYHASEANKLKDPFPDVQLPIWKKDVALQGWIGMPAINLLVSFDVKYNKGRGVADVQRWLQVAIDGLQSDIALRYMLSQLDPDAPDADIGATYKDLYAATVIFLNDLDYQMLSDIDIQNLSTLGEFPELQADLGAFIARLPEKDQIARQLELNALLIADKLSDPCRTAAAALITATLEVVRG